MWALLGLVDLSAAFNTVDHGILVERLSRTCGSTQWCWIGSLLISVVADRRRFSACSCCLSTFSWVEFPRLHAQAFVVPADLFELAPNLSLSSHLYADDMQLYACGHLSTVAQKRWFTVMGVERIGDWMRSKQLLLNPEKTDFLRCATHRRCSQIDTDPLIICGAEIRLSTVVHDLGVNMSMMRHVGRTVGCCFGQLCLIRSCVSAPS